MNLGTAQLTGIERQALEDNRVNRRQPRMYSSVNTDPSPETPYTLDFCQWVHREFDTLLDEIAAGTLRGKITSEENES